MGFRQQGFWLKESSAIKRQRIADIAQGTRIGMAESSDYDRAMDELDLPKAKEKCSAGGLSPAWDMVLFMKGG